MAQKTGSHQAPYELRVPSAGLSGLDPRQTLLLWGVASVIGGVVVSYLLINGEIRLMMLLLLGVLGLSCLSPRRGIYILTIFLPFMYYLRRLVLNFEEFNQRDPILLFPAITTLLMFLGVIIYYNRQIFYYFQHSTLLKACMLLMGVFVLEVFNPLQGNILVGFAGAMYFIVPLAWCFFGLLISREDMIRLLKIVVAVGCITAIYGIYQHYFGLSAAEIYELKSKQFMKTFGSSSSVRIMSTFSGLADFSLYLAVAGFISFAAFWRTKKELPRLLLVFINLYAMVWIAMRTSILLMLFSILMLVVCSGTNVRQIVVRGLAALLLVMALYGVLYSYDPDTMYNQQFSDNPFVVHTLSGLTHPTQETSFKRRVANWGWIVWSTLTEYPVGRGLGSTTPAARKFDLGRQFEADSFFFELFYGSGLVAPILFLVIGYVALRSALRVSIANPDTYEYKICFGLICGLMLGSIFGIAVRDTVTGPLAWLLIGWTVRQDVDRSEALDTAV